MTKEELDFIGSMNMCDEISNEAYKKIMCHCEEREPCEDAISRQAVEKITWEEPSYTDALNVLTEVRDKVRALPLVNPQPKTGWIPVSEKLPETNDDVLVTDGVDMFVAWYSRKGMWRGWMSSDNNFERDTPIEAWMPLPKRYEPQERSDKE